MKMSSEPLDNLVKTKVLKVITVQPGDTFESLSHRMAGVDRPAERFRVLNGLEARGTLGSLLALMLVKQSACLNSYWNDR
jgi:predicted Zn-dependent protease